MQNIPNKNEITLNYNLPIGLRLLIGAIGFMILLFAGRDFFKVIGSFSIGSLFVGLITGVGVLMGGGAIVAAIFAFNSEWKIQPRLIEIIATRGQDRCHSALHLENIEKHNVKEIDTESGVEFAIELLDKDGKRHVSPKFADYESAKKALNLFIGANK